VVSHAGVIDDQRSVRKLIDSFAEFDWRVFLEPRDYRGRVTCDYWTAEYHPA